MTAQNSASNVNKSGAFYKFLPYYLNKVKYLRPQLIMSIIFSVLTYPVFMLLFDIICPFEREYYRLMGLYGGLINDSTPEQYALFQAAEEKVQLCYSFIIAEIVIGILCLVGLFIFTFVTTLRSFRYLYNKSVVDMDMSLPVDHNTRFFGDLAAVFTVNILPHLCAILLGQILLQFADFAAFGVYGEIDAIIKAIMGPMAFTGLFMCIMEIAITLLMMSFCGRLAESCIYSVLINFAIPVIHCMTLNLVESGVYGAVLYPSALSLTIGSAYPTTASSPLGMMVMTVYSMVLNRCQGTISENAPIFRPEYGIPALLVTLACFAGAYFLIKYRRAERVGMPYVYKGMGLVIQGIIIFTITVPVSYMVAVNARGQNDYNSYSMSNVTSLVIGTVVGTFILYIIMELISGRNFRKFGLSVAKWAGTLAACALICFGLNMSNGFGAAYYVPDPARVASARVSYFDSNVFENNGRSASLMENQFGINAYSGDELLQTIKELHEEVPKNNGDWANSGYEVAFRYTMKDGTELERLYSVDRALYDEFRSKMVTPEGWYSTRLDADDQELLSEGGFVGNVWFGRTLYKGSNALFDAVKQDSQKINLDFVSGEPKWKSAEIQVELRDEDTDKTNVVSMARLTVYDWMENTISYLDSIGIDISGQFTGKGYKTAFILKNASSVEYSEMFGQSEGYSYIDYERVRYDYQDMEDSGNNYDLEFSYGRTSPIDPDMKKLIEVSGSSDYNGSGDTYVILLFECDNLKEYFSAYYDALQFTVPAEYNELAESVLQRCMVQEYYSADITESVDVPETYAVS